MAKRIAIIGAGVSGAAAAARLAAAGVRVTVFDKSRGVGGRMSTRRMGALRFDHGAQYFTARGEAFRSALAPLRADGVVMAWAGGARRDARADGLDEALVAAPHMPDAARALVAGCDLVLDAAVTGLATAAGGWSVSCASPTAGDDVTFDAVLVTTPAPQAIPLLATAGLAFDGLDRVVYAPCWALMLAFDAPLEGVADTLRPQEADPESPIAWIARDSSKPGRPQGPDCWVVHAGPAWSRANLELSAEDAARLLLAEARGLLGFTQAPAVAVAHRWRFALVETAAGVDCFWDARSRVGVAGDGCLGPRVEAAFDSGEALARRVLETLG